MLYYAGCDGKPFASMINYPIMKRVVVNFIMFMIRDYLKNFVSAMLPKSLKFKQGSAAMNEQTLKFKLRAIYKNIALVLLFFI